MNDIWREYKSADSPIGKIKLHHVKLYGNCFLAIASITMYQLTVIHMKAKPSANNAISVAAALTLLAALLFNHVPWLYAPNIPRELAAVLRTCIAVANCPIGPTVMTRAGIFAGAGTLTAMSLCAMYV